MSKRLQHFPIKIENAQAGFTRHQITRWELSFLWNPDHVYSNTQSFVCNLLNTGLLGTLEMFERLHSQAHAVILCSELESYKESFHICHLKYLHFIYCFFFNWCLLYQLNQQFPNVLVSGPLYTSLRTTLCGLIFTIREIKLLDL